MEQTYALVFSGATGALLQTKLGSTPQDGFGAAVAGLGDLDLDGLGDLAIGAPDDGGGVVRIYSADPLSLFTATPAYDVSLAVGGEQELFLAAGPQFGGAPYLLLGTAGGPAPGVAVDGVVLPLDPFDPWFQFTLSNPGAPPLAGALGTLTAGPGSAQAAFLVPPASPASLAGLTLHHAYVVFGPMVVFASNPVPLRLVP